MRTILHKGVSRLAHLGAFNWMPDKPYIKLIYWARMGKKCNLDHPQTFNEKLQWLKLYDRKPEYSLLVDKCEVKKYVAEKIGEEYIIPTLGVWDSFEQIDLGGLPDQFVLKCTHDSGGLVICRDKSKLDIVAAKKKMTQSLRRNYFLHGREWPYKNVKPRIIAEAYMEDGSMQGLRDYKFYVFNGEIKYLYVSQGLENHATAKISFLTPEWEFAPFGRSDYKPFEELPIKPKNYDTMKNIVLKLSQGLRFIRIDLYDICGKVYFSEMTFYPVSGLMPFLPEEFDEVLGEGLCLSES